jgi:hypothetical protein
MAIKRYLTCVFAGALLAGCGGGGGGGAALLDTSVPFSGIASKGIVKGGLVQAYLINSDGTVASTPVASATTDENGVYTMTGIPSGALVKLVVSKKDAGTRVFDEDSGQDYAPTENFRLSSMAEAVAGGINNVHITIATDMVASYAAGLDGGKISKASVALAGGAVQNVLGFAPNSKPEFDGTTPKTQVAVFLKAVAKMANDDAVALQLRCTANGVAERTACVTAKLAEGARTGGADFDAVKSKLETKLTAVNSTLSDNSLKVASLGGLVDPAKQKVDPSLPSTAIAQAKAFFESLKNSLFVLANPDDSKATTLEAQLNTLSDELSTTLLPASTYAVDAAALLANGAKVVDELTAANFTQFPSISLSNTGVGCAWYESLDDWRINKSAATAGKAQWLGCRYSQHSQYLGVWTDSRPVRYNVGVVYLFQKKSQGVVDAYTYAFERIEAFGQGGCLPSASCWSTMQSSSGPYLSKTYPADLVPPASSPVDLTKFHKATITAAEDRKSGQIEGFIATSFGRPGSGVWGGGGGGGSAFILPLTDSSLRGWINSPSRPFTPLGAKHGVGLQVALSGPDSELTLSLSGMHSTYAEGASTPSSSVALSSGSYLKVNRDKDAPLALEVKLDLRSSKASFVGELSLSDFQKSPQDDDMPGKVTASGKLSYNNNELFSGKLTLSNNSIATYDSSKPESARNFEKQVLDISGAIKVPEKDVLQLDAKIDGSTYLEPVVTVQYLQKGSQMMQIAFFGNEKDRSKERMDIVFGGDITAKVTKANSSFDIKKNEVVVGTYSDANRRIEYRDGSWQRY